MASIGHFAKSYITNLYDKQKKKKLPPPPPVVTPLTWVIRGGPSRTFGLADLRLHLPLKCSDFNLNLPQNLLCFINLFQDFHWPAHWCISSRLGRAGPLSTTIFQDGHEGPETQNDWRNPPFDENYIPTELVFLTNCEPFVWITWNQDG